MPDNMDKIREFVKMRAAKLDRTHRNLSLAIGKSHAYVNHFVKYGHPQSLPEDVRYPLAKELDIDPLDLASDEQLEAMGLLTPVRPEQRVADLMPMEISGLREQPVYGHVKAGKDILMLNDEIIDYVGRHPNLVGVENGFGLYIHGTSMVPRYRPGELVHVHPSIPPRPGDCVVVKLDDEEALVKELVKMDKKSIVLLQFNPKRKRTIPMSRVKNVYLIVGANSLR